MQSPAFKPQNSSSGAEARFLYDSGSDSLRLAVSPLGSGLLPLQPVRDLTQDVQMALLGVLHLMDAQCAAINVSVSVNMNSTAATATALQSAVLRTVFDYWLHGSLPVSLLETHLMTPHRFAVLIPSLCELLLGMPHRSSSSTQDSHASLHSGASLVSATTPSEPIAGQSLSPHDLAPSFSLRLFLTVSQHQLARLQEVLSIVPDARCLVFCDSQIMLCAAVYCVIQNQDQLEQRRLASGRYASDDRLWSEILSNLDSHMRYVLENP